MIAAHRRQGDLRAVAARAAAPEVRTVAEAEALLGPGADPEMLRAAADVIEAAAPAAVSVPAEQPRRAPPRR